MTPRERIINVFLLILSKPYRYTVRELSQELGATLKVIREDIQILREQGFDIPPSSEHQNRLGINLRREYKELEYLQPLSDSDKATLKRALNYHLSEKDAAYLGQKLDNLYDFQQLNLRALRQPALDRIDQLTRARKEKRRVILKDYRSAHSNEVSDRTVEPFVIDPAVDLLHAYNVEQRQTRHYRLSRITRIQVLEEVWQYESDHRHKVTDIFGIVNNQQVFIHLTVNVFAYNWLLEHFPATKSYLEPAADEHTWDLQCKVNKEFLALKPFLAANAEHVIIHKPAALREEMVAFAKKMQKKFSQ